MSGGIVVGYQGQISGTLNVATNDTVDLQIAEAGSSSLTLNNYGTLAILPYAGVTDVNFPFLTLNNYGALSLQSIVNMNLFGLTLTNYGTVDWISSTISGGGYSGAFIYNYGLWDSQGDWSFNGSGGSGTYFYNIGTFRKSSGINTTALNSVAFYNSGAVEIDSGTLSVPNSITVAAGGLTIGISGTNSGQYGQLVSGGVATLNGPLNVFLANGYKSFAPDQFTILSAASDSGSFSSVSLPSGLSVNYAGAYAWLQSTNMQVIPQLSDTNLQFSFYTFAGQSYTIQTTTNLAGGIWNFYQNTTGNNDFQTFTLPITNTVPELFLRVSQP